MGHRTKRWFAVKIFLESKATGRPKRSDRWYKSSNVLIEERIVLVRCLNHAEAFRFAIKESKKLTEISYENCYGEKVRVRRVGGMDSFELFEKPDHLKEVFSTTSLFPSEKVALKKLEGVGTFKEGKNWKQYRKRFGISG